MNVYQNIYLFYWKNFKTIKPSFIGMVLSTPKSQINFVGMSDVIKLTNLKGNILDQLAEIKS